VVLAALAAATSTTVASQAVPTTELTPEHGPVTPLKDQAMVQYTKWGIRYIAGQQDSHLTVTSSGRRVVFLDTGTKKLKSIHKKCTKLSVSRGVGVSCRIPKRFDSNHPMFLELWPRLGDDYVDGSTLSSMFRMWVLTDQGHDVVYGGDGDDFVNGAVGNDLVYSGAGNDWVRGGKDDDDLWGGSGNDRITSVTGEDQIHGEEGNDEVAGGDGNDVLWGDGGRDSVLCGNGSDDAYVDDSDTAKACESVARSS
jgi:hypothetical protein